MAEVAIRQHVGWDSTAWMRFLSKEGDVFGDFFLGHKPKHERADLDTNELLFNKVPSATWYRFPWCITVPSAVGCFFPDPRHTEILGQTPLGTPTVAKSGSVLIRTLPKIAIALIEGSERNRLGYNNRRNASWY